MERLTRRDFIKLLAGAGLGFGIALTGLDRVGLLNNASNIRKGDNPLTQAFASHNAGGSWTTLDPSDTVGIHAAYFFNPSTGTAKIIMAEGSSFNKSDGGQPPDNTPLRAEVYNPTLGESEKVITMGNFPDHDADLFCCYQAQLPDGNILFAGGTLLYSGQRSSPLNCAGDWGGSTKAFRFNYQTETMQAVGSMAEGRWYPTLVCLANGNVAVFSGKDSWGAGSFNQLVEVYNWETGSWTDPVPQHSSNPSSYTPDDGDCTNPPTYSDGSPNFYSISPDLEEYPRCHLIPHPTSGTDTTGLVAVLGHGNSGDPGGVRTWNPNNGLWSFFSVSGAVLNRFNGCSFLLPLENVLPQQARIVLATGGSGGEGNGSSNAQMFTFTGASSATLTNLPALEYKRNYASQIILPDGKCVVFGGTDGSQGSAGISQGTPEYLDPTNPGGGWHEFNPTSVKRTYHSVAVLLADGSVWTAGGTGSSSSPGLKTIQVFKPPYFGVTRPTISSVTGIGGYGGTMQINTPDAQQIDNSPRGVSLIKLDANTHHFGANQRMIWLNDVSPPVRTSNSMLVRMPLSGVLAPPGYYMVHVLEEGIPSQAKIIKIPGNPDQATPLLTILSPSAAQVISGSSGGFTITVQGTATDAGSGIQKVDVRIGTSNWVSATESPNFGTLWTADVNADSQGPTTIQAVATDNAQNTSSITVPIRVVFT